MFTPARIFPLHKISCPALSLLRRPPCPSSPSPQFCNSLPGCFIFTGPHRLADGRSGSGPTISGNPGNQLGSGKSPTPGFAGDQKVEDDENSVLIWSEEELMLRDKAIAENSWIPVFRFRSIGVFWLLFRLNLCLSSTALCSVPFSLWQQIPIASSLGLVALSAFVSALFKGYLSRIIGVISMDKESKSIFRIGHLSFTGARKNIFVRAVDIVPLSQSVGRIEHTSKLLFRGRPESDFLLLPTHNVEILDERAAYILFGSSLKHFERAEPEKQSEEELNQARLISGGKEGRKKITAGDE